MDAHFQRGGKISLESFYVVTNNKNIIQCIDI